MRKLIIAGAVAGGLAMVPLSASAAPPSCNWGQVTSAAIAGGFDQGGHASSQATPRVGLANVVNKGDLNATCEFVSP